MLSFRVVMRSRSPLSPALWIGATAAAVTIALWFAFTPGSDRTDRDVAAGETAVAASAEISPQRSSVAAPAAAGKPADAAVVKRDAALESLRAKLTRANVVPGEALVSFRSLEERERFGRQASGHGLEIIADIPQLNAARVRYGRVEDLRDAVVGSGGDYANVEGNLWLTIPPAAPQPDPNNQGGRAPFGYNIMGAINAAGDRSGWGANVTVAVLDTGILAHPTFAAGQITHLDLLGDGQSFHSHGTSVASLIGGQNPQAPGVAPAARILDVRVANAEGVSVGSTLAQGIVTAVDRGAQVINISLGGYGDSAVLGHAITYASQRGAVVVAAAGNDAYGQLAVPAAYESVISVGSVDADSRQAYFSNAGAGLDLAAPGVGVVSAWETDKIAFVSGTSQSSALVSAAVASYLAWGVPPSQVRAQLKTDARPAPGATSAAGGVGILTIRPPTGR